MKSPTHNAERLLFEIGLAIIVSILALGALAVAAWILNDVILLYGSELYKIRVLFEKPFLIVVAIIEN